MINLFRRKEKFPSQGPSWILGSLVIWVTTVCHSNGGSISLAWVPAFNANVAGYAVYQATSSGNYERRIDVGAQNWATISDLDAQKTYYFVVTAYAKNGLESEPSNETIYAIPPDTTNNAPFISNLAITPQGPKLMWTSLPGMSYRVVYKQKLDDSEWIDASSVLVATNHMLQWVDTEAITSGQRFYSVVLLPVALIPQITAPHIFNFSITPQGPRLTWTSSPNNTYRVVYKDNLSDPQWTDASPNLPASGYSLQWVDTGASASKRRFYSVIVLP